MRRAIRIAGVIVAAIVGIAVVGGALFAVEIWSRPPLTPIPSTIHTSMSRQDCIDCHAPIAEEWAESYHYKSLTGSYWDDVRDMGYLDVFTKTRKACVNCHAPANVLDLVEESEAASASLGVECTPNLLREPKGAIPSARQDHVELGVDCTSCHVSTRGVHGPGRSSSAPHETIVDRRFQDPVVTSETLCRTCHAAAVEAWKRTSLPSGGVTCLDCHMRTVEEPLVTGGPPRTRRSHGFIADKDQTTLEHAVNASLAITGDRKARFVITNDRVGHLFPSGGNWLSVQFRALDDQGAALREELEAFGKDEALVLDFWPFNTDNRIAFGERRELLFALPEGSRTVEAVVRYHDWMKTDRTILTLREGV